MVDLKHFRAILTYSKSGWKLGLDYIAQVLFFFITIWIGILSIKKSLVSYLTPNLKEESPNYGNFSPKVGEKIQINSDWLDEGQKGASLLNSSAAD